MLSNLSTFLGGASFSNPLVNLNNSTQTQAASNASNADKAAASSAVTVTLSDEAQTFLEQLLQAQGAGASGNQPISPDELFARTDANGDGLVSEAEFVEARPEFASEEQAIAKFAAIDSEGDGLVTQEELDASAPADSSLSGAGAAQAGGKPPPPPPPPPPAAGGASLSEVFDEMDTNEDGVVELSELIAALDDTTDEEAAAEVSDPQAASASLLQAFSEAIKAYSAANSTGDELAFADEVVV